MFGFGSFTDFLAAQAMPLLVIGGALLLLFLVLLSSGLSRHRRMSSQRCGEDVDSFVQFLSAYGFDAEIARTAYEYLVTEEDVAFPIRHTDRLDQDLRISDDEVHRMITHLLNAFGREQVAGTRTSTLMTVEDLLRFVQASPRVSHASHRTASSLYQTASGQYRFFDSRAPRESRELNSI